MNQLSMMNCPYLMSTLFCTVLPAALITEACQMLKKGINFFTFSAQQEICVMSFWGGILPLSGTVNPHFFDNVLYS